MKAFPSEHPMSGTLNTFADGMDLRDYFAAKAMQGFTSKNGITEDYAVRVKESYKIADAMMKARKQ